MPMPVPCDEIVRLIAEPPRQRAADERNPPDAPKIPRNLKRRRRSNRDAFWFVQRRGIDPYHRIEGRELGMTAADGRAVRALQRREPQRATPIVPQDPLHAACAEPTRAVVQKNRTHLLRSTFDVR